MIEPWAFPEPYVWPYPLSRPMEPGAAHALRRAFSRIASG